MEGQIPQSLTDGMFIADSLQAHNGRYSRGKDQCEHAWFTSTAAQDDDISRCIRRQPELNSVDNFCKASTVIDVVREFVDF